MATICVDLNVSVSGRSMGKSTVKQALSTEFRHVKKVAAMRDGFLLHVSWLRSRVVCDTVIGWWFEGL